MAFSACCAFHLFFYVFLRENNPFSKNVQFLHIYFVLFTILRISYSNRVVNNAYYLMQLHEANRVNQLCVCVCQTFVCYNIKIENRIQKNRRNSPLSSRKILRKFFNIVNHVLQFKEIGSLKSVCFFFVVLSNARTCVSIFLFIVSAIVVNYFVTIKRERCSLYFAAF